MKTKLTSKPFPVTPYFPPLSVMRVHSTVSQVLWSGTKIMLIKICFTVYGTPIWMPFGLAHKEHCITLFAYFLKKLQQAKNWDFKCFQHHQVPFQLNMMGGSERLLVCWPGQISQVNMRPSKRNRPPARLCWYIQIFTLPVLLVEKLRRSIGVIKWCKLWIVSVLNPSVVYASWLDFSQGLVDAQSKTR